jgi:hypothetical protein
MKKIIIASVLALGILLPSAAFAEGTYNGNPIPEANGGVVFCEDGYCFVTSPAEADKILAVRKPVRHAYKAKAANKVVKRHHYKWTAAF